MIKKVALILFAVALSCHAGFDQYAGKKYTTCLVPMAVNDAAVTNSATTGTDIIGLVGNGCLVLPYSCTNDAGAILSFKLASCSTTNGSYTTYTNAAGVSSWSYTNAVGYALISFRPNTVSRYLRVYVTPTLVTNGVAGAILVTE